MAQKPPAALPVLPAGVQLVDTHCHLDMAAFAEDLLAVLDRSRAAGVTRLVTIGIDLASSRQAVALAGRFPGVFATVGIHPHHVSGLTGADYDELAALAASPGVVGLGEIGLDAVKAYAPMATQKEHLERQLRLARDLGLPVVLHDREAHADLLAILDRVGPLPARGVMHCFSGDLELARTAVAAGFLVSIPGVVTFPKAEALAQVAASLPLSALLLETDAPYLAPQPRRGRRNEPALVVSTAFRVAELRGRPVAEIAQATTANAEELFRLPQRFLTPEAR
ncbi:MAG: TatD family hydrolase [Thermodesulfobacteriota bacterium]